MASIPTKSRLEQLPLEAKQAILSALTDIESLRATALTCSSLYHAFKHAEDLIIAEVLLNEIDVGVFPEALLAQKSTVRTKIHGFAAEHLQTRQPVIPKKRWRYSEVLPLGRLAKCINYFAGDFASNTLAARPPVTLPPSREELNRIKRAFYRFEIYSNIFDGMSPPSWASQSLVPQGQVQLTPWAIFFASFSPWENEQLACVHDYFVTLLAPIFNDIVAHDVAWAEYSVEYAKDFDSGYLQYLLSLGVEKLYEIVRADSYESRYKLVYQKYPSSKKFLYDGLSYAWPRNMSPFTHPFLTFYTEKVSFFEDTDTGPVDAWSWAHELEVQVENFVFSKHRRYLREWGYVFWDRKRLDVMGCLETKWRHCAYPKSLKRGDGTLCWNMPSLHASWKRRQAIHIAGGTGWWSEEDESKVQWPRGWSPWDGERKKRDCPYCIGSVRCAPHRLVLRVNGKERVHLDV